MSFSSSTKNELCRMPLGNRDSNMAELAAFVRTNGTMQLSSEKKINLRFTTENAAIARRIFSLLRNLYDTDVKVMVRKNRQLKKNNNYLIAIEEEDISQEVLEDVKLIGEDYGFFNPNYRIAEDFIRDRSSKRAYIRGAFLGGGSVTNPEKAYHLEFVTSSGQHAEDLSQLINSFKLNSKVILRKENYIVYIKESEQIADLLNIIGAHQALLKLEDIRVLKDVRNNINRIVNCETANLSKTIEASMKQIENIKYIDQTLGLGSLPDNLREIAELRLEYREASLKELGMLLDPPVGKSGVNHRLRKIEEMADKLKGDI